MVYLRHEILDRALSAKEQRYVEKANLVIEKLDISIKLAETGVCRDGNVNQLIKIKEELIVSKKILSSNQYLPSFGHVIADSWDSDSELGNELLDILCEYKKL